MLPTTEIRTPCPRCSPDRRKSHEKCLALNRETGLYFCHHCGWKGKVPKGEPFPQAAVRPESFSLQPEIQFQPFTAADKVFWSQYRIPESFLQRYGVRSVLSYCCPNPKGKVFTIRSSVTQPIFAYCLPGQAYKLYSPSASQYRFRYLGTKPKAYVFGLDQLPPSAPLLLLTGGEKDVLTLTYLGYPALCLNSETALPPPGLLSQLKKRFAQIGVLYDQDDTGKRMSRRLADQYGLLPLNLPLMESPHKDISDYIAHQYPLDALHTALSLPQELPVPPVRCLPFDTLLHRFQQEPEMPKVYRGIPPVAMGYVVGPPKSGKTTYCEGLAFSLAAGVETYLDEPLQLANRTVLFFSLEEYWQNRLARNKQQVQPLVAQYGEAWLKHKLFVIDEHFPRNLVEEADWQLLEAQIEAHRPGVVFIDSLSRLYVGAIEDSRIARQLTTRLREIVQKYQILLILIHHTPKQIGRPLTIDSIAGSRILAQEADFALGLSRTPAGQRYLKDIFYRYDQEKELVDILAFTDDLWLSKTAEATEGSLLTEVFAGEERLLQEELLDFIVETSQEKGEVSTPSLMEHFVKPQLLSKASLFRYLKKLTQSRQIERTRKACYRAVVSQSQVSGGLGGETGET